MLEQPVALSAEPQRLGLGTIAAQLEEPLVAEAEGLVPLPLPPVAEHMLVAAVAACPLSADIQDDGDDDDDDTATGAPRHATLQLLAEVVVAMSAARTTMTMAPTRSHKGRHNVRTLHKRQAASCLLGARPAPQPSTLELHV